MLLRFATANFLSLRDEAEITFVAAALKEHSVALIPSPYAPHGVVPVLALYGANASGKSNTLHALSFLRWFVLNSFARADEAATSRKPFLLDDESAQKPSRFEIDFVLDGLRYQFGMAVNTTVIVSEWLYQYPKKTRQVLFERDAQTFKFGRALTGSNKQIQSITRPNALFLSAAATSGHPELTRVRDFFRDKLLIRLADQTIGAQTAKELEDDESLRAEVVKYLALADTGIAELRIEHEPIPDRIRAGMTELETALKKIFPERGEIELKSPGRDEFNRTVRLGHASSDNKVRFLDFGDESLGTQYLLGLLPSMLKALRSGATLVLDEITTGLHTLLARQLVTVFQNRTVNKLGAQLVFSTHDTNLLSPGVLRRDEIWFAEKNRDGATVVYPLTDVKTKNTDNIERGYIQGRFGGIPFLEEASALELV